MAELPKDETSISHEFTCSELGSDPPLFVIGLVTTASGQYGMHYFAPIKTAFSSSEGATRFAGGMQTRIYADPGTTVNYFYNAPGGLSVGCAVTVSGSLMPESALPRDSMQPSVARYLSGLHLRYGLRGCGGVGGIAGDIQDTSRR